MKRTRNLALGTLCAALLTITAACGGAGDKDSATGDDLKGQNLVFVNFGGDGLDAAKVAWLDPFSKKTGVKFATDSPSDPAKVKAMVEAGNPTWDIIDLDTGTGMQGCGTLFEKRSDAVDMSEIDPDMITDDCGVPIMVQTLAVVYNAEKFKDNPPTTIGDFLDTDKYPGKRITLDYAVAGTEGLLLTDGTDPENLYPLDLDRAAKVAKKLGNNLSLLPSTAAQSEALESGDFAMCWCYVGRTAVSEERGAKLGIIWENAISGWDAAYAIKGSKSPEAQQQFLNYLATPEAQSAFTEQLPYGPTTPSAKPNIPENWAKWLVQNNMDKVGTHVLLDNDWWGQNADTAFAAWTEMMAG